jgi:hypothetical protein
MLVLYILLVYVFSTYAVYTKFCRNFLVLLLCYTVSRALVSGNEMNQLIRDALPEKKRAIYSCLRKHAQQQLEARGDNYASYRTN